MRIAFQRATADRRNESFLLRVDVLGEPTQCLLFDAGPGVDLDDLLGEDDEFCGTCLTHAHSDHYTALQSVQASARQRRDAEATVYTAPGTAAVLGDVLDIAARQTTDEDGATDTTDPPGGGGGSADGTGDALAGATSGTVRSVDDWTTVSEQIEIRPVPAGHAPGAAGFLVRVGDGDDERLCLVTGDWTLRDAGGTPGLPVDTLPQVDVLFLTTATATGVEDTLTDVVATTLERAVAGAPTLVTANGLAGAHLARLLDTAARGFDLGVPVRVVGHTARLYDQLYGGAADDGAARRPATDGGSEATATGTPAGPSAPDSTVECRPVFDSPGACLDPGVVTIAGPDVPTEQSSGKLFDALSGNPNACVYQVIGSGRSPVREADCTLHSGELANHPEADALETVVDAVNPRHTVVVHERDASGRYNYLDSMVWAGDSDEIHELYDGHTWQMPPWTRQSFLFTDDDEGYQGTVPDDLPRARTGPVNLAGEGVDVESVSERLHARYDTDRAGDLATETTEPTTATNTTTQTEPVTTTAESTESTPTEVEAETTEPAERATEETTTATDAVESTETTTETATGTATATETTTETAAATETDSDDESVRHVAVGPVAAGLAARAAADRDVSIRAVVDEATASYLQTLLAGDADGTPAEAIWLDATVSDGLQRALTAVDSEGTESTVDDQLAAALGTALAPGDVDERLPLSRDSFAAGGVDAVVDNPEFELDSPGAVVEAALCRFVDGDG